MAVAKRPIESRNWLPLLLAATVGLGVLVVWDRQFEGGIVPPVAGKVTDRLPPKEHIAMPAERSINPLANLGLDKLHDTIRRPLFEKNRRPVEPPAQLPLPKAAPAAHVAARSADQSALSLLGIVASEGRTIALLKRNKTGQDIRVEVGDSVDGWTIEHIEPQRVLLRQGDTQIALQLFRKRPAK